MAKKSTRLMQRVYTVFPSSSVVLLGLVGLLSVFFVVLQPRILNTLLPQARHNTLQTYIRRVQQNAVFSPRDYWKFRERYSLGNFTFDPRVVTFGETQIIYALPDPQTPLLYYTSSHLQSTDFIVKLSADASIPEETDTLLQKPIKGAENWKELFNNDHAKILTDENGNYTIVFVRTIDEMKTTNGFFDFVKSEQELLVHSLWLNITNIHDK